MSGLSSELSDRLCKHIELQRKLNDMMHEALSVIAISTTTNPTLIAREALENYANIYIGAQE